MKATGERFRFEIEVQALPQWQMPAAARLKAVLKHLKRAGGFRVTRLHPIKGKP
jgi:hypothetical protein